MTTPPQTPTCYRHPDRATYVRCNRCNRYICPECMRDAAVGHQCAECVNEGAKTIRQPRTKFGGAQRGTTPVVTYVLIAINVVMFVLQTVSTDVRARTRAVSPAVADGELYRLLTSAFLHYGADTSAVQHVGAVRRGAAVGNGARPAAVHRAVSAERAGRVGARLPAVLARAPRRQAHRARCSGCSVRRSWWASG